MCNKITHINGKTVVPPLHAPISREFALVDNSLDSKAFVVLEPQKDVIHGLFRDAPFLEKMWLPNKRSNILRDLVGVVNAEVQKQDEERAAAVRSSAETMQPAAAMQAEAQTKKARHQLQQAAEKRQRRRVVTLAVEGTT